MQFLGRVEKSFLYSKRSISDARKKARDLWDVSTSEGRKKGKKSAEIYYAKVTMSVLLFRFSSVSLREDSRSGRKEGNNTRRVSFVSS